MLRWIASLQLLITSAALGSTPTVHEIPFRFDHSQVIVDVHVDGKGPFPMHLDSGVSPSVVDASVAEAVDLVTSQPAGFVAGYGSDRIAYRHATPGSIAIHGFQLNHLETVVPESSHPEIRKRFLGTLGESFLRRVWVQIDYPKRILRLAHSGMSASPAPADCSASGEVLKADLTGLTPRLLDLQINGQPVTALLDTGASAGLHLPLREARRLGLGDAWETATPVQGVGARGEFEVHLTQVDSVRLGGFEMRDVQTVISSQVGQILVGNGFLQGFVLTFDPHRRQVCLGRSGVSS